MFSQGNINKKENISKNNDDTNKDKNINININLIAENKIDVNKNIDKLKLIIVINL